MNRYNYPKKESWTEICVRPTFDQEQLTTQVQTILGAVKNQGDKALFAYTQKYDGAALKSLLVTKAEIQKGIDSVEKPLRLAIQKAKQNIADPSGDLNMDQGKKVRQTRREQGRSQR